MSSIHKGETNGMKNNTNDNEEEKSTEQKTYLYKEGWIRKADSGLFWTFWQRLYLRLYSDGSLICESKNKNIPENTLNLNRINEIQLTEDGLLRMTVDGKQWKIKDSSAQETKIWYDTIMNMKQKRKKNSIDHQHKNK